MQGTELPNHDLVDHKAVVDISAEICEHKSENGPKALVHEDIYGLSVELDFTNG